MPRGRKFKTREKSFGICAGRQSLSMLGLYFAWNKAISCRQKKSIYADMAGGVGTYTMHYLTIKGAEKKLRLTRPMVL